MRPVIPKGSENINYRKLIRKYEKAILFASHFITIYTMMFVMINTLCIIYICIYEGVSINNQPIPFPMDRDGHDFDALFQYMFYTWVQNCTRIESFFNKILNVKHG